MHIHTLVFLIQIILWANPARGLDFPKLFEGARVLPLGQSTFSVSINYAPLDQEINGSSLDSRHSERLLREVSWGELIANTPEAEKAALRALQQQSGHKDSDILAREYVRATGYRVAIKPFWGFGLGERWTVGARVPVIMESREVVRRTQWEGTQPSGETLLRSQDLSALDRVQTSALSGSSTIEGFDSGWRYHIGDVEIMGQYLMAEGLGWAWALRQKLVLPTSPPPDPYNLDPILTNEGQTDVGLDSLWEWRLGRDWTVLASAGYLIQLRDRVAMRIPDDRRAFLQGGVDRDVERNAGDIATAEVLLRYALGETMQFKAGYLYSERQRDEFKGKSFEAVRYTYLAEGTDQRVTIGRLGLSYFPRQAIRQWNRQLRLLAAHVEMYSLMESRSESTDPIAEVGLSFSY